MIWLSTKATENGSWAGAMKVKTIGEINTCTLDKQINEFIKGKHVIDIKFSSFFDEIEGASFSALIMYEEIGI